ncbi:MAG: hypothetical protein K6G33_00945 [Ruminococcus sp.]|uniref:hypothetical protein n=1 Tax=Ruminococcus sp. TaxID=41978 RepID=UPI0025DF9C04|nr:hypothetical protein [Ruminococcus sp.]MCR5599301.1 hypothetical protein [Ruminococcus sp.]
MDITLVTSSFDNVVHGTDNDKKTGCGINLLKPENVTRFHRTSRMTDLKEITCEKCKANLAKKLIKADKKEMALLLKEERKREKMGLVDEGIVPLGNTTAKITRDPDAKRKEEEARQKAAEEAKRAAEEARRAAEEAAALEAEQQAVPVNNIPGTGIPIDDSLAEFAITPPVAEENNAPAVEDDFLAQFAIQKPDDDTIPSSQSAPVLPQDDFLAQFAIPSPQSSALPEDPAAGMYYDEPEEMDGLDVNTDPAYGQPAYGQPAYSQPDYGQPQQVQTEEDIMKMFSIDNQTGAPAYEQAPVYNQTPVYDNNAYNNEYVQPVQEYAPAEDTADPYAVQGSEFGGMADQGYAYNNYESQEIAEQAPVYPQYDENMPKEMEELTIPSADAAPEHGVSDVPSAAEYTAPVFDDIADYQEPTVPVFDELPAEEPFTAPEFGEIPPVPEMSAPVFDDIPTVPDITAQSAANIPGVSDISAPVLDDISAPIYNEPTMAEQEYYDMSDYNYVAPGAGAETNTAKPETAQPAQTQQPQIIKVPQLAGYDANNQPVYKYVQMKLVGVDQKGQPVYVPVQQGQPQAAPQAPKPQAPVQAQAPVHPQRPVQPQQTAQAPRQAAPAPAQQTAAQAQRAAAAPVQQAPVRSSVPRKPVQQTGVPTANISKIAVNPHSKSTSQAFINAIASSKEYAGKNLIDTQGLHANSPVLTSVEDVLSTMGDETVKKQKAVQAQQAVPVFDEYKAPQAPQRRGNAAPPQMKQPAEKDVRYMSKAELKAKKKQDKIDAKFKKEMSKRGF